MTRRVAFILAWLAGLACVCVHSSPAQTLRLGDPKPPAASEIVACHEMAAQLRREMSQLRSEMGSTDSANSTSHIVSAARVQWRAIAAELLEQPDPMGDPEIVLLGWILAERGEELDHAIQVSGDLSPGRELTAEQRAEVIWQLKRFGSSPEPQLGARPPTGLSRDQSPNRLVGIRLAIRPLIEALTDAAGAGRPASEPLASRLAAAVSIVEGDADLAPLAAVIDRYVELRAHPGWRVEADLALFARLNIIEDVKLLDDTAWMAGVWKQARSAAIAAALTRLTATDAESESTPGLDLSQTAECVRELNELLLLPPRTRPQLDAFRKVVLRWVGESASRNQSPPWSRLSESLATMHQRREHASSVSQHELRMALAALDEQSDELERMMGEFLNREAAEAAPGDPEWVTVIGQHRENVQICETLADLPGAIDYLARFDRRAASTIWPRLLPDARFASDPRARESLLVKAREIVDFHCRYSELSAESRWRVGDESLSGLVGASSERILAQLDAVRRSRAGEIINGASSSAMQSQLDAMHDLFRLVDIRQSLNSARALSSRACFPAEFVARELQRFQSTLQRLLELAPEGGVAFAQAVDATRRDAANVIILAHLAAAIDEESSESDPALEPLNAIAGTSAWSNATPDTVAVRVAQWKMLQFELAYQPGDRGSVPESLRRYAPFLAMRLAEAVWDQSR